MYLIKTLMTIAILGLPGYGISAQLQDNDEVIKNNKPPRPHTCPRHQQETSSYNPTTTQLNVAFGAKQGGKVEIYRNGSLVISANAPAGSTLNYVLRNYGAGNYTVVISCGNTAVYNGNYEVK